MTKDKIRKEALEKRKNIKDKEEKTQKITARFLEQDFYKKAKSIMTYISFKDEVQTDKLIDVMLSDGKVLSSPECLKNYELIARRFKSVDELTVGAYGIKVATGDVVRDIDLVIVPGVAFNSRLHRIGYGAGYYDRFLKDKNVLAVGLFFEEQMAEFKESDNDISLDYIITEERVIKKGDIK